MGAYSHRRPLPVVVQTRQGFRRLSPYVRQRSRSTNRNDEEFKVGFKKVEVPKKIDVRQTEVPENEANAADAVKPIAKRRRRRNRKGGSRGAPETSTADVSRQEAEATSYTAIQRLYVVRTQTPRIMAEICMRGRAGGTQNLGQYVLDKMKREFYSNPCGSFFHWLADVGQSGDLRFGSHAMVVFANCEEYFITGRKRLDENTRILMDIERAAKGLGMWESEVTFDDSGLMIRERWEEAMRSIFFFLYRSFYRSCDF